MTQKIFNLRQLRVEGLTELEQELFSKLVLKNTDTGVSNMDFQEDSKLRDPKVFHDTLMTLMPKIKGAIKPN